MTIGNRLKRNYDMLIVLAGIAIFPLTGPVEDYNVAINTSSHSGIGTFVVLFAAFGTIIIGLILRIYRSISGNL